MKIKGKHIPRYICGLFLAASLADVTTDTGPVVCAVDPTCRRMTLGEIELVRPIFGDAVRYENVRIFNRPTIYSVFNKDQIAQAVRNNVYLSERMGPQRNDFGFANKPSPKGVSIEDDHAGDFVHEITHIWQYQTIGIKQNDQPYSYEFKLQSHEKFVEFNPEQQAEIVKAYFEQRRKLSDFTSYLASPQNKAVNPERAAQMVAENCAALAPFEAKLQPVLPIKPMAQCQPQAPDNMKKLAF